MDNESIGEINTNSKRKDAINDINAFSSLLSITNNSHICAHIHFLIQRYISSRSIEMKFYVSHVSIRLIRYFSWFSFFVQLSSILYWFVVSENCIEKHFSKRIFSIQRIITPLRFHFFRDANYIYKLLTCSESKLYTKNIFPIRIVISYFSDRIFRIDVLKKGICT